MGFIVIDSYFSFEQNLKYSEMHNLQCVHGLVQTHMCFRGCELILTDRLCLPHKI